MVRAMPTVAEKPWPVADPFIERRVVRAADIDEFGHVNNVRYVAWAMEVAWAHSAALGFPYSEYERCGVGCVVQRHEFDYLAPAVEGEAVDVATWIAENDGRVRMIRAFELRRADDGKPLFRGRTKFVTVELKSGRPVRMPPAFAAAYRPAE